MYIINTNTNFNSGSITSNVVDVLINKDAYLSLPEIYISLNIIIQQKMLICI